jgi:hypothetical protein
MKILNRRKNENLMIIEYLVAFKNYPFFLSEWIAADLIEDSELI